MQTSKRKKTVSKATATTTKPVQKVKQSSANVARYIFDPPDVAAKIGVSPKTLISMKDKKEISYRKIRSRHGWGCTEEDIQDYINSVCVLRTHKDSKTSNNK